MKHPQTQGFAKSWISTIVSAAMVLSCTMALIAPAQADYASTDTASNRPLNGRPDAILQGIGSGKTVSADPTTRPIIAALTSSASKTSTFVVAASGAAVAVGVNVGVSSTPAYELDVRGSAGFSGSVSAPTVNATTVAATTVTATTSVSAPTVNATTVAATTVTATTSVSAPTVNATTVAATTVSAPTVNATTVAATTVSAPTGNFTSLRQGGLSVLTVNASGATQNVVAGTATSGSNPLLVQTSTGSTALSVSGSGATTITGVTTIGSTLAVASTVTASAAAIAQNGVGSGLVVTRDGQVAIGRPTAQANTSLDMSSATGVLTLPGANVSTTTANDAPVGSLYYDNTNQNIVERTSDGSAPLISGATVMVPGPSASAVNLSPITSGVGRNYIALGMTTTATSQTGSYVFTMLQSGVCSIRGALMGLNTFTTTLSLLREANGSTLFTDSIASTVSTVSGITHATRIHEIPTMLLTPGIYRIQASSSQVNSLDFQRVYISCSN